MLLSVHLSLYIVYQQLLWAEIEHLLHAKIMYG